ncbi:hypothetical protein Lepto7375DRAFT_0350 [Leptolyngbya sp. PCC 7375]|nr:hypothetical protein Lepto7375DRAFT_0350 [Leptolyngbya sp. PCC 7375]
MTTESSEGYNNLVLLASAVACIVAEAILFSKMILSINSNSAMGISYGSFCILNLQPFLYEFSTR